jgi:hypothetical protein
MITSRLEMMWNSLLKFEKWPPFVEVVTILPKPLEIMNWQHVTMFEFYKFWFTSFNLTCHYFIFLKISKVLLFLDIRELLDGKIC